MNLPDKPTLPPKYFESVATQTDDIPLNDPSSSSTNDRPTSPLSSPEGSPSKKDPNRARYTLAEMQKVLEDRMMYKIKLQAAEDELEMLKELWVFIIA